MYFMGFIDGSLCQRFRLVDNVLEIMSAEKLNMA